MKNKTRISVCIPVHNAELWLAESIQSIIDQTFKDWEIVIVDDHSTDHSGLIINHFLEQTFYKGDSDLGRKLLEQRITCFINEKKLGIAETRNRAVNQAKGEIICVQDADDISHKERLQKTWDYFKRHKTVDLVYGSCQYIDALGRPFHQVNAQPFLIERLRKENWIQHPTVAYRKKAFEDVGGYRPECKVLDDWFLYYDFWKKEKRIDGMNDVISFYRFLDSGVSRSKEKAEEIAQMKEKFLKEVNEDTRPLA